MSNQDYSVAELIEALGAAACHATGVGEARISSAASLASADNHCLSFCKWDNEEGVALVQASKAGVVLVPRSFPEQEFSDSKGSILVKVENPRLQFIELVERFFAPKTKPGIETSAVVSPQAVLAENVSIGANCVIGEARIGAGSIIGPCTVIGDGTTVGENVRIGSCCVLGGDGFGYERDESGILRKFPHIGGIVIEDDVEIGSNTCVDRGTLDNTVIRRGAKVDNLVHVAHNVDIGEDCAVIANAMLGGGVKIGKGAWIAPSGCIINQVTIGAGATVGLGAVVVKHVDDGQTVMGVPARDAADFKAIQKELKKLV